MDDPTRGVLGSQPPDEPQSLEPRGSDGAARGAAPDSGAAQASALGAEANRASRDPKFIGDAMRSLYRSSATSIERGDATRVIGRLDTDSARPAASVPPPKAQSNSVPAGPRVDVTLWLVLALGLFAIAGFMLSAAL